MKKLQKSFLSEVSKSAVKKTSLKSNKLALSIVEDIQEALDRADYSEMIEDLISDAQTKMIEARDIFRFEMMQDLGTAEDELMRLEDQLAELGIPDTGVVDSIKEQIAYLEERAEEVRRMFTDMGYDPIS